MNSIKTFKDFTKFKLLDKKLIDTVDRMLSEDVPKLMNMIPQEEFQTQTSGTNVSTTKLNWALNDQEETPFTIGGVEGMNAGIGETDWVVTRHRVEYDRIFNEIAPQTGKVSGAAAKQEMIKSKLVNTCPNFVERKSFSILF